MKLNVALIVCSAAALAITGIARAGECAHSAVREVSVPANGVSRVTVDASAGALKIVGRSAARDVRARGKACAPTARLLDDVRLTAKRTGETVRLVAEVPHARFSFSLRSSPRLDLVVDLPPGVALDIQDGSGDVQVARVAAVTIEDGSGDMDLFDISGDVRVVDGSGEISIRDVRGSVRLSDGSGDVVVRRVAGNVVVDCDGSGDLDFRTIGGNVVIDADGSGSIDVENVKGSFTVRSDGSGGVRFARVGGQVRIPQQ